MRTVLAFFSFGDCGVVSSPSSPKHIPVAVPATHAQAERTTPSLVAAAANEVPEEWTTTVEIDETQVANGNETEVKQVKIPVQQKEEEQQEVEIEQVRAVEQQKEVQQEKMEGVKGHVAVRGSPAEFSCDNRRFGYYADIANNCTRFHLCYPQPEPTAVTGAGLMSPQRFSFLCPQNTFFDQQRLVCSEASLLTVPCTESRSSDVFPSQRVEAPTLTTNVLFAPPPFASFFMPAAAEVNSAAPQYSFFERFFG